MIMNTPYTMSAALEAAGFHTKTLVRLFPSVSFSSTPSTEDALGRCPGPPAIARGPSDADAIIKGLFYGLPATLSAISPGELG